MFGQIYKILLKDNPDMEYSAHQIQYLWSSYNQERWKLDPDPLLSAQKCLEKVVGEMEGVGGSRMNLDHCVTQLLNLTMSILRAALPSSLPELCILMCQQSPQSAGARSLFKSLGSPNIY